MCDRLFTDRALWYAKPALRAVYEEWYRRIIAQFAPGGPTLEIGGGTGNLKATRSDIVSSDVQWAPWLDIVADGHLMPFAEQSFRNIVLVDVLHHLEHPRLFLAEAARVLVPNGRLIVCEPAITPLSYLFYRLLHHEPTRLQEDPLADGALSPSRNPYDANQAIPTRLFGRDRARMETLFPSLSVVHCEYFGLFAYPLSGGFRPWSALPASVIRSVLGFERRLEPLLGRLLAFRILGVIARR